MATLQHVCSAPLARAVRSRARALSISSAVSTSAPAKQASGVDSRVLLGLSEQELQKLATDFGQVRVRDSGFLPLLRISFLFSFPIMSVFSQQSYRGKQLHHLLYKTKAKDIQDFSHRLFLFHASYLLQWSSYSPFVHTSLTNFALCIRNVVEQCLRRLGMGCRKRDGE